MTSQEHNGTAVDHHSAATPHFQETSSAQIKGSGTESSTPTTEISLKQGKYIPPHLRHRLLQNETRSDPPGLSNNTSTPSESRTLSSTNSSRHLDHKYSNSDSRTYDHHSNESHRTSYFNSSSTSQSRYSTHSYGSSAFPSSFSRNRESKWKEPESEGTHSSPHNLNTSIEKISFLFN
jgi:hypothetical protein